MLPNIKEIAEKDYLDLNCPVLFSDEQFDAMFGILCDDTYRYKFAWQSTLVKPKLTHIQDSIYSIGIDLNFVIFDIDSREIKLNLSLSYYFYEAELHDDWIYLVTQIEIIKISKQTYKVVKEYGLPEIFEEIYFIGKEVEVKCIDGQIIKLGD